VFSLKIRPSTAVATLHCLKKVLLILFIQSLSYSDSSIDWFVCTVSTTYFDYLKSKCWISMTVQAILVILSRIDGLLKRKSAARIFVFLFILVVELCVFKVNLGILRYFSLFYWLFKEKFNIFVTVGSDNTIFSASTYKAKLFVWIPSWYFYSERLWRYSVWSLHCSILASKDCVFKSQLAF